MSKSPINKEIKCWLVLGINTIFYKFKKIFINKMIKLFPKYESIYN